MTYEPGQEYSRIFYMPREEQVARLKAMVNTIEFGTDATQLDDALGAIAYAIHVMRESIFCAERDKNLANRKPKLISRETTLEDLI